MSDLTRIARALCAAHYADRFKKQTDDPHVLANVDANWQSFIYQAGTALAAISPPPPQNIVVAVKPLEWKQASDGRFASGLRPDHFTAENYTVHRVSHGWVIDDGRFTFLRKSFGSEIEAKATAQAHWEQRIRAALSAPTGVAE